MAIKRVFKNTMPGTQYLFRNGKSAQFINGRYETDVIVEIAELDAEIANGIPHIYIDPEDSTVDTGLQDYVREKQIEATRAAIVEYEKRKAEGGVVNGVLAKEPDGTLVKPGADEAQRVQVTRDDVSVGAVGAAKEVVASAKTNTATLKPAPQTGIASSANATQAAAGSAS